MALLSTGDDITEFSVLKRGSGGPLPCEHLEQRTGPSQEDQRSRKQPWRLGARRGRNVREGTCTQVRNINDSSGFLPPTETSNLCTQEQNSFGSEENKRTSMCECEPPHTEK